MGLIERVSQDIAAAMKARDQARLAPLRMAKAALMNKEVERGRPLEEPEAQQVIASLVKQRRDSVEQFRAGGRHDLVERESGEIAILEDYLPPQVDPSELERIVDAAIAETGASSPKDLGRVMKAVMGRVTGGTVDGRMINDLVRRKLGG
jgi:uncharacterized protein YqeY